MELMRHSTPDMTLAAYAETIGDEKRDAGERVASPVLEPGKAASLAEWPHSSFQIGRRFSR